MSRSSTDDDDRKARLVAIGEIAAEVAHELRNALQIVSANVYLARQNLAESGPHLLKIERSARLAHNIVDDLMALARGEPAHAEPIPLVDTLMLAREMLPEPGAELEDHIDPPNLVVRAHAGLASRLFHALYENAIRATATESPGKRCHIVTRAAKTADGKVVIEISDNGPGVPQEIAASLFEPLVSARAGGTGLGLALARRIADAHGGTIALLETSEAEQVSKKEGSGAAFRVTLPS
jgi:signal transduction histidine kinase